MYTKEHLKGLKKKELVKIILGLEVHIKLIKTLLDLKEQNPDAYDTVKRVNPIGRVKPEKNIYEIEPPYTITYDPSHAFDAYGYYGIDWGHKSGSTDITTWTWDTGDGTIVTGETDGT